MGESHNQACAREIQGEVVRVREGDFASVRAE